MRESVGEPHFLGHVEADASRISRAHELAERNGGVDVVCPAGAAMMVGDPDCGPFDPVAAAIGEDVVADAADVPAAEEFPEGIVVSLLHGHDPHVNAVLAHRLGEDAIELLATDGAESFPAVACLVLGLGAEPGCGKRCGREESARREGRVIHTTSPGTSTSARRTPPLPATPPHGWHKAGTSAPRRGRRAAQRARRAAAVRPPTLGSR